MWIADSHIHVWRSGTPPDHANPPAPFDHRQLIPRMDEAGVKRAVLIPPSWSTDDNAVALEGARAYPDRMSVMGLLPLDRTDRTEQIANWRSQPGMLGLRQVFIREPQVTWLREGSLDWFWTAAETAGVPVMVSSRGVLDPFSRIARLHPGLRLIVDHLGVRSASRGADRAAQIAELIRLAPLPNVAVKASRLPLMSDRSYPFSEVHDDIRRVIGSFGPGRVFWGSDLTWLNCTYREAVDMMSEALSDLDAAGRELVMGRALCEWLRWP